MRMNGIVKSYRYLKRRISNFSYHKAFVFMVCLALSSFLWLLSSLEKRYTSKIVVPVSYVEIPRDKQLSGNLPGQFELTVDAYGYTLLSYKLRMAFSPVLLNVNDWLDNGIGLGNRMRFTIFTVNHKDEIEKQISSEIKILSIKPDSLVFNFSKIGKRKVPVKPDLKLNFENQYALKERPFCYPDSVTVTGPLNLLDTIKFISTIYKVCNKLSATQELRLPIHQVPGLTIDSKEISVSIQVEQNTEVSFEIPLLVKNLPQDVALKTFPGKVKVTCRIGLSKYKNLDYSAFKAFVNYDQAAGKESGLPVQFENHSNQVISAVFSPAEVDFILEHEPVTGRSSQ